MLQNWWWIGAAPEFRVEAQNLDSELLGSLAAAEFIREWGDSPPTGRPHVVFQPREGETPQFSIAPQVARRRALRWTQTGHIGKRRLDWTLSAKLETTQAPVYQHVLLVDRRLQIETISVRENGAERLIRWSEDRARQNSSPTRVVIFLGDKTTGVQELTLTAGMPLRQGIALPLPFVRCEEAELVDSRWELFRDPELDVDLSCRAAFRPSRPQTFPRPTMVRRWWRAIRSPIPIRRHRSGCRPDMRRVPRGLWPCSRRPMRAAGS